MLIYSKIVLENLIRTPSARAEVLFKPQLKAQNILGVGHEKNLEQSEQLRQ